MGAGKHPFSGRLRGQVAQQCLRRFAEEDRPRPGLGLGEHESVGLHLGPAQAPDLAGAAPGEQNEPDRRGVDRLRVVEPAQRRAELREVFRAEQAPARRAAVAHDAVAGIAGGFGAMPPVGGAGEHVAQDRVAAVGPARVPAAVGVEPARHVGAGGGVDANAAEGGKDRGTQVRLHHAARVGLPGRRPSLQVLEREACERRAGRREGHGLAAILLGGQQGERGGARPLRGERSDLAEGGPARPAVAPEAAHPRPRPARLHPQNEALQRGVVDCVLAFSRLGRAGPGVGQMDAPSHGRRPFRRARRRGSGRPGPRPRRPWPRRGGYSRTWS